MQQQEEFDNSVGAQDGKNSRIVGLAFANENLEVVLNPNSDCSHCSGLKLDFMG